ncbi:MAG: hypothetical protein KGL39_33490 [Patescibacteria group bacterium]|nr:hypothetical protein [Patescibacteria group bacterium]
MSWSSLTIQEVMIELSPAEQSALQTVGGVAAPPPALLLNALNEARSAARAGGNQLDLTGAADAPTIDDMSRPHVIACAIWRWLTSLPQIEGLQNKQRQEKYDDAQKYYRSLSSQAPNRPRLELPASVDPTQVPIIQPSVATDPTKPLRHSSHWKCKEDGIV